MNRSLLQLDGWSVFLLNDITGTALGTGAHGLDPLYFVRSYFGLQSEEFQNQKYGLVAPWQNVHVMSLQIRQKSYLF
jgi:hypothetical protein